MKKNRFLKGVQIALIVIGVSLTSGCGAKSASESKQDMASNTVRAESQVSEGMDTGEAPQMDSDAPNISTEMGYNRKMIKTGDLQLQTKEFKSSVEKLTAKVQSLGGYIESSDIQGSNYYNDYINMRHASLVIRLPQKNFDNFMNTSSEFGNVVSTSSNSEDITNNYVDIEIRLKSLKIRNERLLELLKESGTLADLFEIEKELGQVTYEIESLSGELQKYDQLVDMSTIHIQIEEVQKLTENTPVVTFGDQMRKTFTGSVDDLVSGLKQLLLAIIACIPFLLFITPIVAVIVFLSIRFNQYHLRKRAEKTSKPIGKELSNHENLGEDKGNKN